MCEANAYLEKDGKEELLLESLDTVEPDNGTLKLTSIFGEQKFIKGKILINFCPKLDQGIDVYIQKLAAIFQSQDIKSVTVVRMEVPCCGGIEQIIQKAMEMSGKFIMTRVSVLSVQGELV